MTDPVVNAGAAAATNGLLAQGLGDLKSLVKRSDGMDEKELTKVARKLEGVFVSMMVKTMRETSSDEGLFGDGSEGEIYGGFFDQMIGESISKDGGLGIAELVIRSSWRDPKNELAVGAESKKVDQPAPAPTKEHGEDDYALRF